MSRDTFARVVRGQKFNMSADAYNAFVEAAEAHRRAQESGAGELGAGRARGSVVKVKNTSGADVARFGILGLDEPLFGPDDNLEEFQTNFALKGIAPAEADVGEPYRPGRFCILQEPIADGRIGRALLGGIGPVQIEVVDEDALFADVADGDSDKLVTVPGQGGAEILWKESGTGTKWALVRIGASPVAVGIYAAVVTAVHGSLNATYDVAAANDPSLTMTSAEPINRPVPTADVDWLPASVDDVAIILRIDGQNFLMAVTEEATTASCAAAATQSVMIQNRYTPKEEADYLLSRAMHASPPSALYALQNFR